jgi:hypothetical protein
MQPFNLIPITTGEDVSISFTVDANQLKNSPVALALITHGGPTLQDGQLQQIDSIDVVRVQQKNSRGEYSDIATLNNDFITIKIEWPGEYRVVKVETETPLGVDRHGLLTILPPGPGPGQTIET